MQKRLEWILFVAFCFFILWFTILSRTPTTPRADLRFMWSYREMLTGDPRWKKDVMQNIQNILFFMLFGFLSPNKKLWIMALRAIGFSAIIEFVQYVGGFGLCELNNVICNSLGAVIGYCLSIGIKKMGRSIDAT